MRVYFAGVWSRQYVLLENDYISCRGGQKDKIMNIHIAGEHPVKNGIKAETWKGCHILETFYYARNNSNFPRLIKTCDSFLLDSGAFTFMQNGASESWDEYVEEYAEFIIKHKVEHFFELDIDSIVGIKEVERLRSKLENITGRLSIPVWHAARGKDYFLKMCEEYPYVAIGGIVTQEIPRARYESLFPWFIMQAHKKKAKIHGLGYTGLNNLKKYHFDSVDSTAWLYGNRGGFLYKFNPSTGVMGKIQTYGRLKSKESAMHNFNEWVKFSKYAELYL